MVNPLQVALVAPQGTTPGFTSVLGKMYDGPIPSAIIWEETASSGDCRLLTPRIPFCESSCGNGAVCVEDGQCQSYPSAISVVTVHVDGLQTSFAMDPIANNYQIPGGVALAWPPQPGTESATRRRSTDAGNSAPPRPR